MTPASRSAAKATTTPSLSWAFSESFVPDDETMQLARAASRQLALGSASQGVTSALTVLASLLRARIRARRLFSVNEFDRLCDSSMTTASHRCCCSPATYRSDLRVSMETMTRL